MIACLHSILISCLPTEGEEEGTEVGKYLGSLIGSEKRSPSSDTTISLVFFRTDNCSHTLPMQEVAVLSFLNFL